MADALGTLVPLLVPFVLSVVGLLLGSTFVTTRRLRNDLQRDTEILARLPSEERLELRAEVRRRSMLLVAQVRFPTFTHIDLVALLGYLGSIGALVFYAIQVPGIEPAEFGYFLLAAPFFLGGWALRCWWWFYGPWSFRAAHRIKFVREHLGDYDARAIAFMARIGNSIALIIGLALVPILTSLLFAVVINHLGWLDWVTAGMVLVPLGMLAVLFLISSTLKHTHELIDEIDTLLPDNTVDPPPAREGRQRSTRTRLRSLVRRKRLRGPVGVEKEGDATHNRGEA